MWLIKFIYKSKVCAKSHYSYTRPLAQFTYSSKQSTCPKAINHTCHKNPKERFLIFSIHQHLYPKLINVIKFHLVYHIVFYIIHFQNFSAVIFNSSFSATRFLHFNHCFKLFNFLNWNPNT